MIRLRHIPYRVWLLAALLIAHAISMINPADYSDMMLEHAPTVALLAFLIWLDRRGGGPLSNVSCTLIFCFLILHVIGAHYLYSNVPYDDWSQRLFGVSLSKTFGWERNHFDRLVHLMFGLLMTKPMSELMERWTPLRGPAALIVSVSFIALMSKLYELGEWLIAVVMDPAAAEAYNGQQGDNFDAHKDMALALVGAIISATIIWIIERLRGKAPSRRPSSTQTAVTSASSRR